MGEQRAFLVVIRAAVVAVAVLGRVVSTSSAAEVLFPINEVKVLVAIKAALRDPNNVLSDWVTNSGKDPCHWRSVSCSDGRIYGLELGNLNLSGTLSPAIGKLRRLRNVLLDHNAISGPIPHTIGRLPLLQRLDLSHNHLTGSIPHTLGGLRDLFYMKLSHNILSGFIPDSLATAHSLFFIDLSFNNLSGLVPAFTMKNVLLNGNPLLHHIGCRGSCGSALAQPELPLAVQNPRTRQQSFAESTKTVKLCLATAFSVVFFFAGVVAVSWQWRRRHQIFAAIDGNDMLSNAVYAIALLALYKLHLEKQ